MFIVAQQELQHFFYILLLPFIIQKAVCICNLLSPLPVWDVVHWFNVQKAKNLLNVILGYQAEYIILWEKFALLRHKIHAKTKPKLWPKHWGTDQTTGYLYHCTPRKYHVQFWKVLFLSRLDGGINAVEQQCSQVCKILRIILEIKCMSLEEVVNLPLLATD